MLIGLNVRRIRQELGLTQEAFAERSGFSQQYISDLERGRRNPTLVTLFELAQALGRPHTDLIAPETPEVSYEQPTWAPHAAFAETAWRFVDFRDLTAPQRAEAARILREALAHMPDAYDKPGEAEAEVQTFLADPERFAFAAVDGDAVLGWIGAIETYSHAWELHPLVVDPSRQRQGVGAALAAELETRCRAKGILVLYLGSDDAFGGTSLFGRDLFPGVLSHAPRLAPAGGHPFVFYQRLGYEVVGLIPDANGPGKPDILMAKRIAPPA